MSSSRLNLSRNTFFALQADLTGIQAKRTNDGMRFCLLENGHLSLDRAPTGLWERFIDLLADLWHSRSENLGRKYEQIKAGIIAYLSEEENPERLTAFFATHSYALGEMFREAKINPEGLQPFIQTQLSPDRNGKSEQIGRGHLHLTHQLQGATVSFQFNTSQDGRWQVRTNGQDLTYNASHKLTFSHKMHEVHQVRAVVERTTQIPDGIAEDRAYEIDALGNLHEVANSKPASTNSKKQLTLHNRSAKAMTVTLPLGQLIHIAAGKSETVEIERFMTQSITAGFTTDSRELRLGLKTGKYSVNITEDGEIETSAQVMRAVELRRRIPAQDNVFISNLTDEPTTAILTLIAGRRIHQFPALQVPARVAAERFSLTELAGEQQRALVRDLLSAQRATLLLDTEQLLPLQ